MLDQLMDDATVVLAQCSRKRRAGKECDPHDWCRFFPVRVFFDLLNSRAKDFDAYRCVLFSIAAGDMFTLSLLRP